VSIDVCDGSVLLGRIVDADSVELPSRISRLKVGVSKVAMASGRSPSIDTSTTCSVTPVRFGTAILELGSVRIYRGLKHPAEPRRGSRTTSFGRDHLANFRNGSSFLKQRQNQAPQRRRKNILEVLERGLS